MLHTAIPQGAKLVWCATGHAHSTHGHTNTRAPRWPSWWTAASRASRRRCASFSGEWRCGGLCACALRACRAKGAAACHAHLACCLQLLLVSLMRAAATQRLTWLPSCGKCARVACCCTHPWLSNLPDALLSHRTRCHVSRANFTLWAIYLVLSPLHWYPLPFWPFAPGSMGIHEAHIV